jgi:hypothetical protein
LSSVEKHFTACRGQFSEAGSATERPAGLKAQTQGGLVYRSQYMIARRSTPITRGQNFSVKRDLISVEIRMLTCQKQALLQQRHCLRLLPGEQKAQEQQEQVPKHSLEEQPTQPSAGH